MIPDVKTAVWPGWETVDMLGQGSFGAVYEIRRDVFGDVEKAALKVISIPQSKSELDEMYGEGYDEDSIRKNMEEQLKNIVSEYSLMRKLNGCANVVHCDDVRYEKKADGLGWNIYIKMELLHPLMQSLPQQVTEETVVRIGKEMCNALIHCGYHGIIHRDIKPQNMFLTADGSCKLGDFGIAKTIEKTTGGTKIGTFKYMAPEVYNNKPYGAASDIYSLGLVLYWLLNERRMPFVPLPPAPVKAGMDGDAANRRLMGDPIPEPKNGSVALKQIVLKACAYDPKDRFHSAAEMLNALENMKKEPLVVPVRKPVAPVQQKDSDETLRVRQTVVPLKQSPLNLKPEPINHPVLKNIPPPPPEPVKSRSGTVWILLLSILIVAAVIGGIMVLISLAKNTPKQNKMPEPSADSSLENVDNSDQVKIGDIITFGSYEQDNDLSNGKENIEWVVLDVQDGKALILSKYGLTFKPYHTSETAITWEECSLRGWLNNEFVNDAFTENDRMAISYTSVPAGYNPDFPSNPGPTTQDHVFLLSAVEVQGYANVWGMSCQVTEYAKNDELAHWGSDDYSSVFYESYRWWLRTPGSDQGNALTVLYNGDIIYREISEYGADGESVTNNCAVRPALWLDLEKTDCDALYKDAPEVVSTAEGIAIGSYVTFGSYEQDNNLSNGKEKISWKVLEIQDGKALLLSEYGLDFMPYNTELQDVTWETSTLRKWLNNDFITAAFTEDEKKYIPIVTVEAENNPYYDTEPGADTQDQVFLLGVNDVMKHFAINNDNTCFATEYAKSKGEYEYATASTNVSSVYYGKCHWWLRTPGDDQLRAVSIFFDGDFVANADMKGAGSAVHNKYVVRPALWIDLDAIKSNVLVCKTSDTENVPKKVEPGSYISFGQFEQDNREDNGKEDIEWLVLDVQDDKALVISRYALDTMPYYSGYGNVTWETSEVREWLNDEFLKVAFAEKDRESICMTIVPPGNNPEYNTDPGNATQDKLFLLSFDEVNKYLTEETKRTCRATEYAARITGGLEDRLWWLRTPGGTQGKVMTACSDGLDSMGTDAPHKYSVIRPAMWVALNSNLRVINKLEESQYALSSDTKVGDTIQFGTYEQDGANETNAEPISWQVLDIQDGKALVISKYALNSKRFNDSNRDTYWELCALREWLNNEFINDAFSPHEQEKILTTQVTADENPDYTINLGNTTNDKIFLLSIAEAEKYFPFNDLSGGSCTPTQIAIDNYAVVGDLGKCSWWLRTSGSHQDLCAYVNENGYVNSSGDMVVCTGYGIRPAMWISL